MANTISYSKVVNAVNSMYEECGIQNPLQLPLEVIVNSKNIFLKEEEMDSAEGRIIMRGDVGIITINSKIEYPAKKRFVLAHEFGHFVLHKNVKKIFNDTEDTLNQWYQNNFGVEEIEANEFAAEFLMPSKLFYEECKGKKFGPEVIDYLCDKFQVSKTAAILRFAKRGNHPIFVVYCKDNKTKWWKKSDDFRYFHEFEYDKKPPGDSVAYEVFTSQSYYKDEERKQTIWKSTWFNLKANEKESIFYEYCLFVKAYNYSLSVIWED